MLKLTAALVFAATLASPAAKAGEALGVRPGPDILYAGAASSPQLENSGVWEAAPILVSGASAYRDGEFLYQDFLYDDLGAGSLAAYPADSVYAGNAADFVEVRLKRVAGATAVRITYNSMIDPAVVATTIALGDSAAPVPMPHGANASTRASVFVTVHGSTALVDGAAVSGASPTVAVDLGRRQVEVQIPHAVYDPSGGTAVRVGAATGVWDVAAGRYLMPVGAGPGSAAFFNVAFRYDEPLGGVVGRRESAQASALASGDLSSFYALVDFTKMAAAVDDDMAGQRGGVPVRGFMNPVFASHFETRQGRGDGTAAPVFAGRLQSYSLYVPATPAPAAGYGLTVQLHGSGGTQNAFQGTPGAVALGEQGGGSIVFTPEARGPSHFYFGQAAADVFEGWADVARRLSLDDTNTLILGVSMGGYGAYKLAASYPDLFAAVAAFVPCGSGGTLYVPGAAPPGGEASAIVTVADSLRHVPSLSFQSANDQFCTYAGAYGAAAIFNRLDAANITYEARTFVGAEHALVGNLILDSVGPVISFAAGRRVVSDPARVTFSYNAAMSEPQFGVAADHAYWVSGLTLADAAASPAIGTIDVVSFGFGTAVPAAASTQYGQGLHPQSVYPYVSQFKVVGAGPPASVDDRLDIVARNIGSITVDPVRARVSCGATVNVVSDHPISVTLKGCP